MQRPLRADILHAAQKKRKSRKKEEKKSSIVPRLHLTHSLTASLLHYYTRIGGGMSRGGKAPIPSCGASTE